MKIYSDINLENFDFWSGAKQNASTLILEQFHQIETILEDIYPDGMNETELNDLFWFDFDTIREWIGLEAEE